MHSFRVVFASFLLVGLVSSAMTEIRQVFVDDFFFEDERSHTQISQIREGDTIRWVWRRGFHTTTSDTGLWDAPIDSGHQTFEFTFNTAGSYPYHCIPHRFIGMVGEVRVMLAGDVNGDGCVNDADLAAVLLQFGQSCNGCPEDLNGDGFVNDADLTIVLLNFGRCS